MPNKLYPVEKVYVRTLYPIEKVYAIKLYPVEKVYARIYFFFKAAVELLSYRKNFHCAIYINRVSNGITIHVGNVQPEIVRMRDSNSLLFSSYII